MERFSYSVILIMAFSRALELGLVDGLGDLELARPSQGELAFGPKRSLQLVTSLPSL